MYVNFCVRDTLIRFVNLTWDHFVFHCLEAHQNNSLLIMDYTIGGITIYYYYIYEDMFGDEIEEEIFNNWFFH